MYEESFTSTAMPVVDQPLRRISSSRASRGRGGAPNIVYGAVKSAGRGRGAPARGRGASARGRIPTSNIAPATKGASPGQVPEIKPSGPVDTKQPDSDIPIGKENVVKKSGLSDFTKLPTNLDSNFEEFDTDAGLHSTIIKASTNWNKQYQKALLAPMSAITLNKEKLIEERNSAFDLLDALTRSGVLDIDEARFHVIIAATNCFDKTIINTAIQDNVNPIETLERSMLILASTIHELAPESFIKPDFLPVVKEFSPNLFSGNLYS